MTPDAGWYDDPNDSSVARFWDGERWTEQTRPRTEVVGPEPPAAPASDEGSVPPAGPPPSDGPKPRGFARHPATWIVAVLVVGALVAGAVLFLTDDEAGAEVILEPVADEGDDPFMDSIATTSVDVEGGDVDQVEGGGDEVEAVFGDSEELYGGTGDERVCDPDQMVAFLEENDAEAEAFADVLGIETAEIEDHVAELTPLLLREDTRVTNHGFRDGDATPFQSVLQAGNAVLVDDQGVPRVRCACGNPLAEPEATDSSPDYTGSAWDGFEVTRLVAIQAGDTVNNFTVVNVETGDTYETEVGSGTPVAEEPEDEGPPTTEDVGTGEFQATIVWSTDDDMDLHVIDPEGFEIDFGTDVSPSGGELDFDEIPGCGSPGEHVENVFWPAGGAPSGTYEVFVVNFDDCDGAPTDVTLQVRVQGDLVVDEVLSVSGESERFTVEVE